MKKRYIIPRSKWLNMQAGNDVLAVVSPDVNKDGSKVKVDEDESGNACISGRFNRGLWDDPDEME